jgi:undecaprenyl-diphosphatase
LTTNVDDKQQSGQTHVVVRAPWRSHFAWRHPKVYLGAHTVVALMLSVLCTWVFLAIADEVPEKGAMVQNDVTIAAWLQTHGTERGEAIFSAVSRLGDVALTVVLVVVVIWLIGRRDWIRLATLAVTSGGAVLLNHALKATFERTRPEFAAEFAPSGWSFPSGHAMDSFVAYGLLAYWLWNSFPRARSLVGLAAVSLVGAIGFSRVYLGVHFVSDVLAGYCAGLVWLTACIGASRFAERRGLASPS